MSIFNHSRETKLQATIQELTKLRDAQDPGSPDWHYADDGLLYATIGRDRHNLPANYVADIRAHIAADIWGLKGTNV